VGAETRVDILSHRLPHLARLEQLDTWADQRYDARSELPSIVRRLIQGTNDSVVEHMGGGISVDSGGYDGTVTTMSASAFVPAGISVWELGVSKSPKTKADQDYDKRTKDPLGAEPAKTTFVFVTPRLWAGAHKWAAEKRAEGIWKDVVVRDAVELHSAMVEVPTVHVYFSELLGMQANGVRTLAEWWRRYTARVVDRLPSSLLLTGREQSYEDLLRTLSHKPSSHIYIEAPSVDDVIGFVAASLIEAAAKGHPEYLERALVVFEPGAMLHLGDQEDVLILIPFAESLIREAELASSNSVIFRVGTGSRSNIALPRLPIHDVRLLLVKGGLSESEAHTVAVAAYRSLPLLKASLLGEITHEADAAAQLLAASKESRRMWMLGAWNLDRTGDLDVLKDALGTPFDDASLNAITHTADPVFTHVGSSWKVISPAAHVVSIASRFTSDDVDALERAVQTVLGAVDPTLELDATERWRAGIWGPGRLHSTDLRTGIATTLAAFGALGKDIPLGPGTLRGWAELIVRATLERAHKDTSGLLWVSIVDQLPLLAEAAPDEVLTALARELDYSGPLKEKLFGESSDLFSPTSPHVYVLWALETMAWSDDYLADAVRLLTRLAEIDPGGQSGNRPARSIENIFRPWNPQTASTLKHRIAVLRATLRKNP
jgi:hypothetical protein